jgi:hypothetical protein
VYFDSLKTKKKYLNSDSVLDIEKLTIFVNQGIMVYIQEEWIIYVDLVVEDTTEDIVKKLFKDTTGIEPKSIGYTQIMKKKNKTILTQIYRRYKD